MSITNYSFHLKIVTFMRGFEQERNNSNNQKLSIEDYIKVNTRESIYNFVNHAKINAYMYEIVISKCYCKNAKN